MNNYLRLTMSRTISDLMFSKNDLSMFQVA